MNRKVVNYEAESTLSAFHLSEKARRGVMGPVGSGKSVGCVMEVFMKALSAPVGKGNVRKSRWAVIRNTYGELKSTTIKTWQEWIPDSDCPIVYDSPIRGKMAKELPDGTFLDFEVYFIALNNPKDVKKLLSLELTGVWVNEAREIGKSIVDAAYSRTGRYPAKKHFTDKYIAECEAQNKPLYYSGLIMDTNPPDDDHWWYRLAEEEKPDGWGFFRQPGALIKNEGGWYSPNPLAENVKHQPKGYNYWLDMLSGADPEWIKVHVLGEYGAVFTGRAVFKDIYIDSVHVSDKPLEIFKGLPLMLGFDFGLTPACVIGQMDKNGQLRILRELVSEYMAIRQFTSDVLKPALNAEFRGMPISGTADPAGEQRSQVDAKTCIQELRDLGIPAIPAPTNSFSERRQAVIDLLTRRVQGNEPALIIDPSCKMIRKGFMGGYEFERVAVVGQERFKDMPVKNIYSHIMDATQYLALGVDYIKIAAKKREKQRLRSSNVSFKQQVGWEGYV